MALLSRTLHRLPMAYRDVGKAALETLVEDRRLSSLSGTSTSYIRPSPGSHGSHCSGSCNVQRCLSAKSTHFQGQQRWSASARPWSSTFVYKGPLSQPVKNLKRLSLGGCIASVVGGPVLVFVSMGALPLIAKISLSGTVAGFGVFTTSLLHWFTSPYVHRLQYDREQRTLDLETLDIFARPQRSHILQTEIAFPDTLQPQATFQAKGKVFYIDADSFEDKELLECLTPTPAAATEQPVCSSKEGQRQS